MERFYNTCLVLLCVVTTVEVQPRSLNPQFELKPADRTVEPQLIAAYLAAFHDTIEYCDWELEKITDSAKTTIRNFFAGKRGNPLLVSRLAVDTQSGVEHLIGAALFVEKENGQPLLDILFVLSKWQRQGLATTLVSAAINELDNTGVKTLESRYMLGNEASQTWHQTFGFVEEPDLFLARLSYRHAEHELWHREKIGNLAKIDRQILVSEVQCWKSQVNELEAIAEQKGMEAVYPLLRG